MLFLLLTEIVKKQRSKITYDLQSLGSGNSATEKRPYSSYFSLPPLYLALACAGEEEGGGMVYNLKIVLFIDITIA